MSKSEDAALTSKWEEKVASKKIKGRGKINKSYLIQSLGITQNGINHKKPFSKESLKMIVEFLKLEFFRMFNQLLSTILEMRRIEKKLTFQRDSNPRHLDHEAFALSM